MITKTPDKISKDFYNYYTHNQNINDAILKTFKTAIRRTQERPSKDQNIPHIIKKKKIQRISTKQVIEVEDTEINNRMKLKALLRPLKIECRKLKGMESKMNTLNNDFTALGRLAKDLVARLQSTDPKSFLNSNTELSLEKQPPETKEKFWRENFFTNQIQIKEMEGFEIKEEYLFNVDEMKRAMNSLKTKKASDTLNLNNEYLKFRNKNLYLAFTKMFNDRIINFRSLEDQARRVKLIGIPKDKDSFRPICITSITKSIFDSIVLFKLNEWIERNRIIAPNQIGFMENMNVYDHIQILKERIKTSNNNFMVAFVDLRKAYNSIERQILYDKLENYYNIDKTLLLLIRMSVENNFISLLDDKERRTIQRGLPQGNRLSPMLFNLFFTDLVSFFPPHMKDNILLYADDVAIVTHHEHLMQEAMELMNKYCVVNHIEINVKKTKILASNNRLSSEIIINDERIEIVKRFKYLGLYFNQKGIDSHLNVLNARKIVVLKSFYLRKFILENKIYNIGIITNIIKMYVLSNVNFFWPMALENKYSKTKLEVIRKRPFKIIFGLNQRFPTQKLEAIFLLDSFELQLGRIANKFIERTRSLENNCYITKLMNKIKLRTVKSLESMAKNAIVSKKEEIKCKQKEMFGMELYNKIPFNSQVSYNIRKLLEMVKVESVLEMEPEIRC